MTNFEGFIYDLKQYLAIGAERRLTFGKTFYDAYYRQSAEMGISQSDAKKNMERLVAYISGADGEISKSEYEFCNSALFTISAVDFLNLAKQNVRASEIATLKDYAHKSYQKYGRKSYFYIIGILVICANGDADINEQKKFANIFGLLEK